MAMKRMILGGLALAAVGCSMTPPPPNLAGTIAPREAVVLAADSAPRRVPGVFAMLVRATGKERGQIYLNSELDYRDQRNLTISIEPGAARALERGLGGSPESFFKGKWIEVRGAAQRVKIGFFENSKPTGLYYYQTHVRVSDPNQIVLAIAPAS